VKAASFAGSLIVALFFCAGAYAEQHLNAHYEISVTDHGTTNTVRSMFRLKPGETERLELYPNTVELSVRPISDQEYDLRVLVVPRKPSGAAVLLNQQFRGKFGVPLELSSGDKAVQLGGAISVVVL
jgi:hypothetical protein